MRSILIHADHKRGHEARLDVALAIARQVDGHVTVLVDTPVSHYVGTDPMGGSYVMTDALADARAQNDEFCTKLETRLGTAGVPFEMLRSDDEALTAIAYAAPLADLVIVGREGDLAGDVALAVRAPVMALGPDTALEIPVRHASIAWDGGEHAAAAMRGAVPLLARCESVQLIAVTGSGDTFPAADALRYLERHGISATFEEHARQDSTEQTLAQAVAASGAQLLVMGAYGKSRVREFLFGGVTAHFLLEDHAIALLLAH